MFLCMHANITTELNFGQMNIFRFSLSRKKEKLCGECEQQVGLFLMGVLFVLKTRGFNYYFAKSSCRLIQL